MLNYYHIEFLNHLISNNVDFLVIGGQARKILTPLHVTSDLDIWLDIDSGNKDRSSRALQKWKEKHPTHSSADFTTPLRPKVQIHFPEIDITGLKAAMGIDILTSIEGMSFHECMEHAITTRIKSIEIKSLCDHHLKHASDLRKNSSH